MTETTTKPTDLIAGYLTKPVLTYRSQRAKSKHRKAHPRCEICNVGPRFLGRANDVHHIIPVAEGIRRGKPGLAWDADNLITACRWCHFVICHGRNWGHWNGDIDECVIWLDDLEDKIYVVIPGEDSE